MPDEFELQSRVKRSEITSSKEGGLNVETLVVADRKMLEKHGRENVTTYVLTVMNMVRELSAVLLLRRHFDLACSVNIYFFL